MNSADNAARAGQHLEEIRSAVASGNGKEAERLADKYKVPNVIRIDLGVATSSDPKKAPPVSIG